MSKRRITLPIAGSRITAAISVTFVLLILGLVGLTGIAGRRLADTVRANAGFAVVMSPDATEDDMDRLQAYWQRVPYVASVRRVSPEQVLDRWNRLMDDSTDVVGLLGENPFGAEWEVTLLPGFDHREAIERIIPPIESAPGVETVRTDAQMIDSVSSAIRSVTLVLAGISLILLAISLVLIVNTVRLTVYARRLLIHTMKLVGASPAFIRRPFVRSNLLSGIVSGLLAALILWGIWTWARPHIGAGADLLSDADIAVVAVVLVVLGAFICSFAAWIAASRFIRASYDDLFR